jgi:hypothetical protein
MAGEAAFVSRYNSITARGTRRIEPRHGRQISRDNQTYSRRCFADLEMARAFLEQFGGAFYKTTGT